MTYISLNQLTAVWLKMCFRKCSRFFIHSYYYSLQTMNPQSTSHISEFEPDVDISLLVNTSSPANLETNSVLIIDISSDSGSVFMIKTEFVSKFAGELVFTSNEISTSVSNSEI